ncbi:hypothetical protein F4808DRAFT_421699 [Astrocystis sublimbata]|nr:hypothetical protein F4808DRAFT_421699 [Astrocystis sublimbata]
MRNYCYLFFATLCTTLAKLFIFCGIRLAYRGSPVDEALFFWFMSSLSGWFESPTTAVIRFCWGVKPAA